MKTIEQFKEEYLINDEKITKVDIIEQIYDAIDATVKFAESWIDVNEELPEYGDMVLLKTETGEIIIGYYLRGTKYRKDNYYCYPENDIEFVIESKVTHFRPLNRP